MSMPICPFCGSANVVPAVESAGANHCLTCGKYGVVADFHREPDHRYLKFPDAKTILAEVQQGNQTHRRRGQPPVIRGKTQRPSTQTDYWWDRD